MTTPPPVTRAHREAAERVLDDGLRGWSTVATVGMMRQLGEATAQALASAEHRGRTEAEEGGKGWVAALEQQLRAMLNDVRGGSDYDHGKRYAFQAALAAFCKLLPPPPPGDR